MHHGSNEPIATEHQCRRMDNCMGRRACDASPAKNLVKVGLSCRPEGAEFRGGEDGRQAVASLIRQARPAKRISSLTRFQHRHNQNHVDSREDATARIISPSFVEEVRESDVEKESKVGFCQAPPLERQHPSDTGSILCLRSVTSQPGAATCAESSHSCIILHGNGREGNRCDEMVIRIIGQQRPLVTPQTEESPAHHWPLSMALHRHSEAIDAFGHKPAITAFQDLLTFLIGRPFQPMACVSDQYKKREVLCVT